ncbi:BH3 interacting domain death agonist [Scyliorhinus torazame]|uniref:BH3 interacting domain death agonist n=1 Tax=Scyliorhinus torazame TaxID=75743 RepID=UPI003B5C7B25
MPNATTGVTLTEFLMASPVNTFGFSSPDIVGKSCRVQDRAEADAGRRSPLRTFARYEGIDGYGSGRWSYRVENKLPVLLFSVNPVNEELYRQIAAHLADIGDRLDQSINRDLVEEFIRETERIQPQMDGTIIMSSMITRLTNQRIDATQDMPQEKVFLLLALMLFKKTVVEKPVLLSRIFRTTVQYINNRLQDYIRNIGGWQNIH